MKAMPVLVFYGEVNSIIRADINHKHLITSCLHYNNVCQIDPQNDSQEHNVIVYTLCTQATILMFEVRHIGETRTRLIFKLNMAA